MSVLTISGNEIDEALMQKYFDGLVGSFFKILPLYESGETSLITYLENLRDELLGCKALLEFTAYDGKILSLASTLEYLIIDISSQDTEYKKIKRKVFGAISVCKKLSAQCVNAEVV